MTLKEFGLKIIAKFSVAGKLSQAVCRSIVAGKVSRRALNNIYSQLSKKEKVLFHYNFSRIFRNVPAPGIQDCWTVMFMGIAIKMPLRQENLWLDWDLAVSIMGHDLEVKSFYERVIRFKPGISWFFDIGANYGTHSVLFLSQGIKAITFEPNPACQPVFEELLKTNNLTGRLENYAIGEANYDADLVFDKGDTWDGTIQTSQAESGNLETVRVKVITLDQYVAQQGIYPDVIKIDTEGFELNVLMGGKKTLTEYKPIVIFESNYSKGREELFTRITGMNYAVYLINSVDLASPVAISEHDFVRSADTNFVAMAIL